MLKAIVFDLDNTLVDFMGMKTRAVDAAIDAMVDAGIGLDRDEVKSRIDAIYKVRGIEYQQVLYTRLFSMVLANQLRG